MIASMLVCASIVSADPAANQDTPTAEQTQLLKTFRAEFIHITPGRGKFPKSFRMGRSDGGSDAERPVRTVTFTSDFHIAKYEVPQNLYEAVVGKNPSRWKGKRNSVELVDYDQAVAFCEAVTRMMRASGSIDKNQEVRLPSEAQWEYVARAGSDTVYSFGNDAAKLDKYAWHTGNAKGNDPPVGAKAPNPWGLYDIHGYLWEWCQDSWHTDYRDGPTDGSAWTKSGDGKRRVIRGGSWKDKAPSLTSSYRKAVARTTKDDAIGLRCVLSKKR